MRTYRQTTEEHEAAIAEREPLRVTTWTDEEIASMTLDELADAMSVTADEWARLADEDHLRRRWVWPWQR